MCYADIMCNDDDYLWASGVLMLMIWHSFEFMLLTWWFGNIRLTDFGLSEITMSG